MKSSLTVNSRSGGSVVGVEENPPTVSQQRQEYEYLVVIDFEATCDNSFPVPKITSDTQEVIEFPFVVIQLIPPESPLLMSSSELEQLQTLQQYDNEEDDASSTEKSASAAAAMEDDKSEQSKNSSTVNSSNSNNGCRYSTKIIDQQQYFVKPDWSSELTPFCTELTGITNDTIQRHGLPLHQVIQRFDSYLTKHFIDQGRKFMLVSDGQWDLKQLLLRETIKKRIALAPHYRSFFDLRLEFQSCFPQCHVRGLKSMVQYANIEFCGRHHSGISDCLTICKLISIMVDHGHIFRDPIVIHEHYDPFRDTSFRDFNLMRAMSSPSLSPSSGGAQSYMYHHHHPNYYSYNSNNNRSSHRSNVLYSSSSGGSPSIVQYHSPQYYNSYPSSPSSPSSPSPHQYYYDDHHVIMGATNNGSNGASSGASNNGNGESDSNIVVEEHLMYGSYRNALSPIRSSSTSKSLPHHPSPSISSSLLSSSPSPSLSSLSSPLSVSPSSSSRRSASSSSSAPSPFMDSPSPPSPYRNGLFIPEEHYDPSLSRQYQLELRQEQKQGFTTRAATVNTQQQQQQLHRNHHHPHHHAHHSHLHHHHNGHNGKKKQKGKKPKYYRSSRSGGDSRVMITTTTTKTISPPNFEDDNVDDENTESTTARLQFRSSNQKQHVSSSSSSSSSSHPTSQQQEHSNNMVVCTVQSYSPTSHSPKTLGGNEPILTN